MPEPSKIFRIDSVKLSVSKKDPPELTIKVDGTSSTPKWTNAALSRHEYGSPPQDGIQEFDFIAIPPSGFVLQVLAPISALHTVKDIPEWLRGVRVYSDTNNVEKVRS